MAKDNNKITILPSMTSDEFNYIEGKSLQETFLNKSNSIIRVIKTCNPNKILKYSKKIETFAPLLMMASKLNMSKLITKLLTNYSEKIVLYSSEVYYIFDSLCVAGNHHIIKLFLSKIDINVLHMIQLIGEGLHFTNNIKTAKFLLSIDNNWINHAFVGAFERDNKKLMKFYIKKGCDYFNSTFCEGKYHNVSGKTLKWLLKFPQVDNYYNAVSNAIKAKNVMALVLIIKHFKLTKQEYNKIYCEMMNIDYKYMIEIDILLVEKNKKKYISCWKKRTINVKSIVFTHLNKQLNKYVRY